MKDKDGAEIIAGERYKCLNDCGYFKVGQTYLIQKVDNSSLFVESGQCCAHPQNWERVQPVLKIGDIVEVVFKEDLVQKWATDGFIKRCGKRGRITGINFDNTLGYGECYYIDFSANDPDEGGETFFFRGELVLIKRLGGPEAEPTARSIAEEFKQEYYLGATPGTLSTKKSYTMKPLQSLSVAIQKVLSSSKKKQYRADYLNEDLSLSPKGRELIWTLLAEQFDKELTAAAQEELDAEKK